MMGASTLTCFGLLCLVCSAEYTYVIDWADVVDTQPDPLLIEETNTDIGQCICDLTFDMCDVNCLSYFEVL